MWRHNASWGHPSLLGRNVLAFIQEPLKNGRVSWTTVILHYTLPVQFAISYQDSPLIWTIKPTRLGAIACGTGAKREWGPRRKSRERKGKGSLPSLPNPPIPLPLSTPAMVKPDQQLGSLFGSLSNDDGDRNEDGKKAIGLDWKNNSFARAPRFFAHSLLSLHDYKVKVPNFTFCRGREHLRTTFFFFSWTLIQYFRIPLQKKNCQNLRI